MTKLLLLILLGSCWASFCCTMTWRYLLDHKHYPHRRWSCCDHCGRRLTWWQLIPVWGFLLLRGHCKYCHTQIDYWWPLCELLMGILWGLAFTKPLPELFICGVVSSACLIISTQDHFDHRFQPIWLLLWPLILIFAHWPRHLLIDICQVGLLACGYYCSRIGHGDLDAMIMLTIVLGSFQSSLIILAACLLALADPPLYQHQPVPFIPFLSLAFLCYLAFPVFGCWLC